MIYTGPCRCFGLVVILGSAGWFGVPAAAVPPREAPRSREFLFTYETTVTGLAPGQKVRVWLPVPPSNREQEATLVRQESPTKGVIGTEPRYGNQVLSFEAEANREGKVPLRVIYRVKRYEAKADLQGAANSKEDLDLFLKPDARVPIGGKPLALLAGLELPKDQLQQGRVFYDVVNRHLRYGKEGQGWGQGDAVWACDSGFGNCSDFHSLFIALARSHKLPARFEMGFPLPPKRGQGEIAGYHCWAWFRPEKRGWVPVDISEANKDPQRKDYYFGNLTEDRVLFSTGRDLTLVPKQDGPPLNFFIYPHAEADGKPYPVEKIERRFRYQDLGLPQK
jgi:transglutaminase-like putative cysteine protease